MRINLLSRIAKGASQQMRMTRDSYAREVFKAIEALHDGEDHIACPHETCEQELDILMASLRAGTAVTCPDHGVIFRE